MIADGWLNRARAHDATADAADRSRAGATRDRVRAAMRAVIDERGKTWLMPTRESVKIMRDASGATEASLQRVARMLDSRRSRNSNTIEGDEMAKAEKKTKATADKVTRAEKYDALRVNCKVDDNPCRSETAKAIFALLMKNPKMADFRAKAVAIHKGAMSYFRESLERDYVELHDAAGRAVVTYKDTPGGHPYVAPSVKATKKVAKAAAKNGNGKAPKAKSVRKPTRTSSIGDGVPA